jgi:hypothetical protein
VARLRDKRECPYCGRTIVLGECPIVATNLRPVDFFGSKGPSGISQKWASERGKWNEQANDEVSFSEESDDGLIGESDGDSEPVSGAPILSDANGQKIWIGDFPMVAEPPVNGERGLVGRGADGLKKLPSVTELAEPEDLPQRVCTECNNALPPDLDDRVLYTIAVIGTSGAGKSHYLATALGAAYRQQKLEAAGCLEFTPDESTAAHFHKTYYAPLFRKQKKLPSTHRDEQVRLRPLVFRTQFPNGPAASLLFHDVDGEALQSRAVRNRVAPFVRRADAVIFLIDPDWIDAIQDRLPDRAGELAQDPGFSQGTLLSACADEMTESGRDLQGIPFAISISKSDLISQALGRDFRFSTPAPDDADAWLADMDAVGIEVEDLLAELEMKDLLSAARRLPKKSFHAVAAIGHSPIGDTIDRASFRPVRCLDPLAMVLNRLPSLHAEGGVMARFGSGTA